MPMISRFFISFLSCVLPLVFAQPLRPESAVSDSSLISSIRKLYGDSASIELQFDLDIFWKVRQKHEQKKGTLQIAPHNKFKLDIGSMILTSDGESFWQYTPLTHQVIIRPAHQLDKNMIPSYIVKNLSLKPSVVTRHFPDNNSVSIQWKYSTDDSMPFDSVNIQVNLKSMLIYKLIVIDRSANQSIYTIKQTKQLKKKSDALFIFTIPKGVETLDLRH